LSRKAFPEPTVIYGRLYWAKGPVRGWLAEIAGQSAPEPRPDDEQLLTSRAMREQLLGGISEMSLWRWRHRKASSSEAA
jgi:hypothetical protein